jgi:hypothetical protein
MINKKLFFGKFILIFAILVAAFIACAEKPNSYDEEFDPDGRLKKKYAREERNIKICQALSFILGASEGQKCKADPSLNECKNYSQTNYFILAGNCYGYPNM